MPKTEQDKVLAAATELKARRAGRTSLKDFILYTYPRYMVGKHHQLLFNAVEKLLSGKSKKKRLMVFMPPRHGKSVIVSRRLPAFYLGKNPDKFVLMASYEENLATGFGRDVRNLVNGRKFENVFPGIKVAADSKAAGQWNVERFGGGFYACGIGSGLTGRGADLAIIDDPVKDRQQADSDAYRERAKEWYQSTFETRLAPDALVILCMTRWHHDDLAGWLLEQEGGDEWEVLNLVGLIETENDAENDPLKRSIGEALWPEKWPAEALLKKRVNIGLSEFEALYQGRPSLEEGAMFKRENFRFWNYNNLPEFDDECISIDPNLKETTDGAECCVHHWARSGPSFYLLDRAAGRWDFSEAVRAIDAFRRGRPGVRAKLFEDTAAGPALMNVLRQRIGGIIPAKPKGKSKEIRAKGWQPYHESGNIYIPEQCGEFPWVDTFITRVCQFPHSKEKDDVDTASQAINRWIEELGEEIELGWDTGPIPGIEAASEEELEQLVAKHGDMTIKRVVLSR